ncbi:cation-translocating P-type ATPase [Sphaerotilus sp.]|uniref:heavy metal translocating P-type ATPase n=1 Tax=Sphaerotilus sp. TaxID=2093942 RepID=UPI002ACE10D6|nr:cation-translocating P-type ATPase [Sphaerotilus sp.]MDZ7856010.1 cation-translocating P-type ATPase [Sphaerotilus sp.]
MSTLASATPSPIAAPALSPTQAAAVNDAQQQAAYTQWIDDGQGGELGQSRLLLSGMHCTACAGLIEDALCRVEGVQAAEVSGAAQRAVVTWDPKRTQVSTLIEAVRRAGYGAFPDTGAQAVALATRETRQSIWRLFVAAFCMMQVMMYATPAYVAGPGDITPDMLQLLNWASWVLSIPVIVFAAGPFFRGAWRGLRERRISMDLPVALGIAVTFVASSAATFNPGGIFGSEVYFDSLTMFVSFLFAARVLEARARQRAAQSLDGVMRRLPDAVERLDAQGQGELVPASVLAVGDRVRVHAGQAFAADGCVVEGRTLVDEAMLSGESRPVDRTVGDEVSAGCINLSAPVVMQVLQLGAQTRYQRIVSLVERALTERPAFILATDRIAGPFLWAVLALATLAWGAWMFIDPSRALWVAVSVLIVTCPCALSLGAPVALLASAGELARRGILVQRLDALEILTRVQDVVFDKTGTVTEDRLTLAETRVLQPVPDLDRASLERLARSLAQQSRHPLSRALALSAPTSGWTLEAVTEQPGQGMDALAQVGGRMRRVRLGGPGWCGVAPEVDLPARPAVWLGVEQDAAATGDGDGDGTPCLVPVAVFEFDEVLRPDAISGVAGLARAGLSLHLFSGDQTASVEAMARRLGIADARARCTPQDKLAGVEALQGAGRVVAMVGDGINDAPVLARADVSIALGTAAALAQARADVIVLSDRIEDLPVLLDTARRTVAIVRQNLRWSLTYNAASVPLALVGWLPPWLAGLGMALSSLVVVLNALRLTRRNASPTADKA